MIARKLINNKFVEKNDNMGRSGGNEDTTKVSLLRNLFLFLRKNR
jgi:hypothetical protein